MTEPSLTPSPLVILLIPGSLFVLSCHYAGLFLIDDTIYFAVGFKSYDITRPSDTTGEWYDWTERSRNSITRTSFTVKKMEWISSILREASQTKGNIVRRWKKKDAFAEIYCTRNFNRNGRYISLINVRGRRRAVIIVLNYLLTQDG